MSHIPLVKLLGLTPTGLNASSEGEIRVFYDYVKGYQKNVLSAVMMNVLRVIQRSLYGAIDDDISWNWHPMPELTDLEAADVRNKDADTDLKYIEAMVIAPEQVRERLAADPNSLYAGIVDLDTLEAVPDDDIAGITEKILEIGQEDAEAPMGAAGGLTEMGLPPGAQAGVKQQEEEVAAERTQGAHASNLTQDPSPEDDPGLLKA